MWRRDILWSVVRIAVALLLFLFSIDLMQEAFKFLGINAAESIIFATSNPYIGLFIGLLITAIIQSSSTSTSMIVAMVASNAISLPEAIPMIMGANIGTTLTSSIVSLGFITKVNEFRKALSAAIFHDFFNVFTVIILLPLEINYGILSSSAIWITENFIPTEYITSQGAFALPGFFLTDWLRELVNNGFILVLVSFVLLFIAIKFLADNVSNLVIGRSRDRLKRYFFNTRTTSFTWGTVLTAAVQSSSITTSLVVPLAATGKVSLRNAAPFIMGANIGTTITAIIAALFKSDAAISIAIAHLLFNLFGVLIFLLLPFMRNLIIFISASFGRLVIRFRLAGLLYVLLLFFIVPFALIYFNQDVNIQVNELTYEKKNFVSQESKYFSIINKKISNRNYDQWLIFDEGPDYSRETPNEIFRVFRNKNILFINEEYYFINKEGYCWNEAYESIDYKICIDKIYNSFELTENLNFDSVYVYRKTPVNSEAEHIIEEVIDVSKNLLLVRRRFNKKGELIFQEKLVKTKEL